MRPSLNRLLYPIEALLHQRLLLVLGRLKLNQNRVLVNHHPLLREHSVRDCLWGLHEPRGWPNRCEILVYSAFALSRFDLIEHLLGLFRKRAIGLEILYPLIASKVVKMRVLHRP